MNEQQREQLARRSKIHATAILRAMAFIVLIVRIAHAVSLV